MIISNFLIGYDNFRQPLYCGDVVRFTIQPDDWNENEKTLEGMVIYDQDIFGFVFYTLDEEFPAITMNCENILRDSIKKIVDHSELTQFLVKNEYKKWESIYAHQNIQKLFTNVGIKAQEVLLDEYKKLGSVEDLTSTIEFISDVQQALQISFIEERDLAIFEAYEEYRNKIQPPTLSR